MSRAAPRFWNNIHPDFLKLLLAPAVLHHYTHTLACLRILNALLFKTVSLIKEFLPRLYLSTACLDLSNTLPNS